MPLNVVSKAASAYSSTPSHNMDRQPVEIARPTASTARAEALKARLTGKMPSKPVESRPTGSTARREQINQTQKFEIQSQGKVRPQVQLGKTPARREPLDLASIAPPPSGLAEGAEPVQVDHSVETPKPATEANSEPLSPQFVALARRERQIRKAQQDLKAAQDAWKQEQAEYIPKKQLTSETLKVLSEAGITPDKLVELQINQAASQDPQQILLNRIAELESKLNGIVDPENGELAKRDKAAYDQVVSQIRQDAKLLVDSNPSFGTIKSEGKLDDVVTLITRVFDEEGIALDVEEAAQLVEDKLSENLYKRYEQLSKYEKIKAKLGKALEASEATPAQPTQPTINTLTHTGASQRQLSPRERAILKVQEAMNAKKGR